MKYKSLYREYRPSSFNEIVGQDMIIKALTNSVKKNIISHAYLFAGSRGTGKTTTARVLAKAINCLSTDEAKKPCNKCEMCFNISKNTSTDVIEFDAASNNGVNEIRDIRNNVQLLPFAAKYKIYIIDEVHMLSISAFNALLKTLEEPPEHVVFIFATTEFHKIPATIISRCQNYFFRLIDNSVLKAEICKILDQKSVEYEERAIHEIAVLANGSLRDALTILEQILLYTQNSITLEIIYEIFALVTENNKLELLKSIIDKNYESIFLQINQLVIANTDFKMLIKNIVDIFKESIEYKFTKNNKFLISIEQETADYINNNFSFEQAQKIISILLKYYFEIKDANAPGAYFELAILEIMDNKAETEVNEAKKSPQRIKPKEKNSRIEITKKPSVKSLEKKEPLQVKKEKIPEPTIPISSDPDIMPPRNLIYQVLRHSLGSRIADSKNKFQEFQKKADEKLNKLISLSNYYLRAAAENYFIITVSAQINANELYKEFAKDKNQQLLKKIYDKTTGIIIVSDREWTSIKPEYLQLRQADKISKNDQIMAVDEYYFWIKGFFPQNENKKSDSVNSKNFHVGKEIFDNFNIN